MYGPCLSAIVGGHALTPPTRHSLGGQLPRQQADRTQARPLPATINRSLYSEETIDYYFRFLGVMVK